MIQETHLHPLDVAILRELQSDGRVSNVELARRVHLSPPATQARVKRLEKEGLIRQYGATLDREKAGFDLLCFIQITIPLHQPQQVEKFRTLVRQMPEVLECHHITGESDHYA